MIAAEIQKILLFDVFETQELVLVTSLVIKKGF